MVVGTALRLACTRVSEGGSWHPITPMQGILLPYRSTEDSVSPERTIIWISWWH